MAEDEAPAEETDETPAEGEGEAADEAAETPAESDGEAAE